MENDNSNSINKRLLWKYVNRKIKHTIHRYHVFGVMNILFDELLKDLKNGKEIEIFNFGSLKLKDSKARLYHDVTRRQVLMSKKHRILKFSLASAIRKKLCKHLKLDTVSKGD